MMKGFIEVTGINSDENKKVLINISSISGVTSTDNGGQVWLGLDECIVDTSETYSELVALIADTLAVSETVK